MDARALRRQNRVRYGAAVATLMALGGLFVVLGAESEALAPLYLVLAHTERS